jgi:hypothetical protein
MRWWCGLSHALGCLAKREYIQSTRTKEAETFPYDEQGHERSNNDPQGNATL